MIQAHYQTTPRDLQHMLDAPSVSVTGQFIDDQLVGVALLADEGPLDATLHPAVMARRQRPQHALTPQLLAHSVGQVEPLTLRYRRVVRIAVLPAQQRRGLGSRLLDAIVDRAATDRDAVSASFGADQAALAFWLASGFTPVHRGYRRNPRSGLRSVCVIKALSPAAAEACRDASLRLADNLAAVTVDRSDDVQAITDIDRTLCTALQATVGSVPPIRTPPCDRQTLTAFCQGHRSLVDSAAALRRWHLAHQPIIASRDATGGWLERLMRDAGASDTSRRSSERTLRRWLTQQLDEGANHPDLRP